MGIKTNKYTEASSFGISFFYTSKVKITIFNDL